MLIRVFSLKVVTFFPMAGYLFIPSAQANIHAEFGVKGGYQIYTNESNNPDSISFGAFMNVPITKYISIENAFISLGEGEEKNFTKGTFNIAEISAVRYFDVYESQSVFIKAGAAPWFGQVTQRNSVQSHDYGIAPTIGLGYSFPMHNAIQGRIEYQLFPKLGSEKIGYTDSHLFSFGLSWKTPFSGYQSVDANPHYDEHFNPNDEAHQSNNPQLTARSNSSELLNELSSSETKQTSVERADGEPWSALNHTDKHGQFTSQYDSLNRAPHYGSRSVEDMDKGAPQQPVIHHIFGSWFFEHDSSALLVPRPFDSLDAARNMVASGCQVTSISSQGYADSSGDYEYNKRLSDTRASIVSQYIKHALNSDVDAFVAGRGSVMSHNNNHSQYERLVNFALTFVCK